MTMLIPAVRSALVDALHANPAPLPQRVRIALAECDTWVTGEIPLRLEELAEGLARDFDFLATAGQSIQLDVADRELWVHSLRGVLSALDQSSKSSSKRLIELRILLVLLGVLTINLPSLRSVVGDLRQLIDAALLSEVFSAANIDVGGWDGEVRDSLEAAANALDLESIAYLSRAVMASWRLDLAVAISLLYELEPDACARAVSEAPSILTGMLALEVLGSEGTTLALNVDSVAVKFLSVLGLQETRLDQEASSAEVRRIEELTLQVSRTKVWSEWIRALRLPSARRSIDAGTGRALARMDTSAWRVFFSSLSLDYSGGRAEPMARLLLEFAQSAQAQLARGMWAVAFEVWKEWDYGSSGEGVYHGQIPASVLDFPVANYFAQANSGVLNQEEARLLERIEQIEQEWFESLSTLITVRNVLLAKLRLVRHGRTLAGGENLPLPAPTTPYRDKYSMIRYHG